ncbi:MAG TPA: hypothetical protein VMX36_14370 [Sedimentisphaerales bacterium]|nr:hypothetical protein [Sedimentisphaerales bacterium]
MWNVKKFVAVLMLTCTVTILICSGATGNGQPKAAELVQAVRASENWIHEIDSLYVRIETKLTRTPEAIAAKTAELKQQYPDLAIDPSQFPELKPVSTGILEFAIDKQRVRSLSEQRNSRRQVKIWDGKQLMVYNASFPKGPELYSLGRAPQGSFQDMLAYETSWPRAQPHSFWWDIRDVDELMSYYGHAGDSSIAGRCNYRGVDCYILDVPPRGIPGLVTVQSYPGCEQASDRRQYGLAGEAVGLAGQSFRWYVGAKDHRLYSLVWLSNKKPRIEYWMSDYKEVRPGCWLPMAQGCEVYRKDNSGQPCVETHSDLRIVDARINESLPDELFRMDIKEGAIVADSRSGRTVTYTYKPEPPDLVGKALPESVDTVAGLDSGQAKDGKLLVCFWDMQQRPSRHCMKSLAQKAGNLADRGITVLCVHAGEVDKAALNEWIRNYNVPFAAKTITHDAEKTRFAWGVKSLPWLILTDQKHIVEANGFSLAELDERI